MKPIVRWAGGKRWLVPELNKVLAELPAFSRLVEPFAGGMALTLALEPEQALINDINPHLISLYKEIQSGNFHGYPEFSRLSRSFVDLPHDKLHYYAIRTNFNELIDTPEESAHRLAIYFYYLNRTCFNGLCRFNRLGKFNTPYGKLKSPSFITDFSEYTRLFKHWEFTTGDFDKVSVRAGDLVYCDPPYDTEFVDYFGRWDWQRQIDLVAWVLRNPQGTFVVSQQATPRVVELYSDNGFIVHDVMAPRRIAANGNRDKAREIIAVRSTCV